MKVGMKMPVKLLDITKRPDVQELISCATAEDIGTGDVTTNALASKTARARAVIISRADCIVSGVDVAKAVFRNVNRGIRCAVKITDGQPAKSDQVIMNIEGPVRGILAAERTVLNFMQRMTGIATFTKTFVEKVKAQGTTILDTRKTTPTLRVLEKYAVLCGGGQNHRMGLYDMALIKDNHRALWRGGLNEAVQTIRKMSPGIKIEVEVENERELESALKADPDWILLDNMSPARMRRCVKICGKRARLEASGGITLSNVKQVARTGVDAISLGCLTHSAPAADLSMEILK